MRLKANPPASFLGHLLLKKENKLLKNVKEIKYPATSTVCYIIFKIPLDSVFTFTSKHKKQKMKKSIFIMSVLAISLFGCAQNPPKNVADNFNKKFQNATKVKWDQEEKNEWEAEFKMNGDAMSASYDNSGKWLETEKELKKNQLPTAVQNAFNTQYAGYKLKEASAIEKPDFKGYELGIEKGKEELEILVSADGTISSVKKMENGQD